jgi:4,5-dihydroxyphthalate decarboxylase
VTRVAYAGTDHFARTLALREGGSTDGLDLGYRVMPIPEAIRTLLTTDEFDAGEMSLSTFFALVGAGDRRFVGLPVFTARYFRHRSLYVRTSSTVVDPADLRGGVVGVPDYHQTAALWVRAFLEHDHGLPPSAVEWVVGGLDVPNSGETLDLPLPDGISVARERERSLTSLLADGEIDALIAPRRPAAFTQSGGMRRLFPDFEAVERRYFERTGIFPIMHLVVLRRPVYEREPELASLLLRAFVDAGRAGDALLGRADAVSHPWWEDRRRRLEEILGSEPFAHGIRANAPTLDAALGYAYEQRLVPRRLTLAELFAAETLES